jgi:hypothetical protein
MTGFSFRKSLIGTQAPAVLDLLGSNSVVFQVGDAVRIDQDGNAALVTTGDDIHGFVTGVVGPNGESIDPDSGTLDTYTMASNNETVAGKKVRYVPAFPFYLFYNDADDTLAATNNFQYFDLNDENDVDVATASDTTGQVQLVERDPDGDADASKGLFRVRESTWAQVMTSGIEA